MINIYFDNESIIAKRVRDYLLLKNIGFNSIDEDCSYRESVVYIGFIHNCPSNLLLTKKIIEIDSNSSNIELGNNTQPLGPDVDNLTLEFIVNGLDENKDKPNEIVSQYSKSVHDILGDLNHISGYTQLIQIENLKKEISENCAYILQASRNLEEKIKKIRLQSFEYIFTDEYSRNFKFS